MAATGAQGRALKAGFYEIRVENDLFQVPQRYENLQLIGGGAYGEVWSAPFVFYALCFMCFMFKFRVLCFESSY